MCARAADNDALKGHAVAASATGRRLGCLELQLLEHTAPGVQDSVISASSQYLEVWCTCLQGSAIDGQDCNKTCC